MGWGDYIYNTSVGGGLGLTRTKHSVNFGVAYVKPLDIRGELAMGWSWGRPIQPGLRDQTGMEVYWKILLTPDLWLTPGVQVLFNPTFNPAVSSVTVPQIKLRLFL